jgi:transcriptional regulator of acetoin/glycerol metabolism
MQRLVSYDWPGNIRELRNVLERASTVATDGVITENSLPPEVTDGVKTAPPVEGELGSLKDELARAERRAIERALSIAGGNRTVAARLLGIHRTGLYQKMKRHNYQPKDGM